ncbi:hypothetical protein FGRMN_5087 [Fusarium graminum]|nr:hypothetical protein FGRMN_5087 [Fusarium graminum]
MKPVVSHVTNVDFTHERSLAVKIEILVKKARDALSKARDEGNGDCHKITIGLLRRAQVEAANPLLHRASEIGRGISRHQRPHDNLGMQLDSLFVEWCHIGAYDPDDYRLPEDVDNTEEFLQYRHPELPRRARDGSEIKPYRIEDEDEDGISILIFAVLLKLGIT